MAQSARNIMITQSSQSASQCNEARRPEREKAWYGSHCAKDDASNEKESTKRSRPSTEKEQCAIPVPPPQEWDEHSLSGGSTKFGHDETLIRRG